MVLNRSGPRPDAVGIQTALVVFYLVAKGVRSMGVEVLDTSLEAVDLGDDIFDDEEEVKPPRQNRDARRRLEDKLEELRLRRELRDYDFDL